MNIILLSGGSGKRLWPLSNDIRSKQFIKIFKNDSGELESMVQRVYRQILGTDISANITIATSKKQASAIQNQLGGGIGISVEPFRRDTFPAILLAALFLKDVKGISIDETVVICPVDPFVQREYFECLEEMSDELEKGDANIVLMGIKPTYPSEKYGYIIPSNGNKICRVVEFKEKPDLTNAKKYIENGGLWNGGVFALKLEYIINIGHEKYEFEDYYDLFRKYEHLPKISFDYAVVEKELNIKVVRFSGEWRDLGTWNTLTEAMDSDTVGNGIIGKDCSNVNIINELDIPILAMGLQDVVISASPEGILVSDKEQSSFIKPYVDNMDQRVKFAEKSWGNYLVLDVENESLVVKVTLNAGHKMNYHSHNYRDEIWVVISGSGTTIINGKKKAVSSGDSITMKAGTRHTVIAKTELQIIEVQIGKEISVSDKQKYSLDIDK